MSAGRRLKSHTSGKRSAPILFYMPEGSESLDGWYRRRERYAPRPSARVSMARTGQLYHLFVDDDYVDTFTSPAISDGYQGQAKLPHIQAAIAKARE